MDAALKERSTDIPVVTVGSCSYMDPDAIRAWLSEAFGPGSWRVWYNCLAPEVYTCDLDIKGVNRTAVADFNRMPDLMETATEKFDFVFALAAHAFGMRGRKAPAKPETEVVDITDQIEARDAAGAGAGAPPPVDDKLTPPTDAEIDECLAYAIRLEEGHKAFWESTRAKGMSNADLKTKLGEIFGIEASSTYPVQHYIKGGKEPRLWVKAETSAQPTLKGVPLLYRVRAVTGVTTEPQATEEAPAPEQPTSHEPPADGEQSLADLVRETSEEIGDGISAIEPGTEMPAGAMTDEHEPPGEETAVLSPEAALSPEEEDHGAEEEVDPMSVFAEAAAVTQTTVPSGYVRPSTAPPTQKMQEVAQFLENQGLKPPTTAAAASDTGTAICPAPGCGKVVPPALAAKCREAGQIPMHPGCQARAK